MGTLKERSNELRLGRGGVGNNTALRAGYSCGYWAPQAWGVTAMGLVPPVQSLYGRLLFHVSIRL